MQEPDEDAYRNRVAIAVYEAVVTASRGNADAAVILTGTAFDALLMVASLLIAGSPEVDTPAKAKQFSEAAAKKLRRQIAAARADPERARVFANEYDPKARN